MFPVFVCLQNESTSMSKSGIGKLQNLSVVVQRRWNNVLSDATRQQIVEMFLGLRMSQHFPSIKPAYVDSQVPLEDETDTEGGFVDDQSVYVHLRSTPSTL